MLSGCAGSGMLVQPHNPEKILHYSKLSDIDESRNLNNFVIYINEGESIPLKINMDTEFMEFKEDHVNIVAKQKLYFMIQMPENLSETELQTLNKFEAGDFTDMSQSERRQFLNDYMLYISRDAIHWAPLYGGRAYREVLGFKEGTISLGIMASATDGLGASLGIKTIK
jgi:hypothetical protein